MNISNFQFNLLKALEHNKKVVTDAHDDYEIRVGTVANNFQIDNPVVINDPADHFSLTLPDGVAIGQMVLVTMLGNDNSKECDLSITHHETSDPEVLYFDAADEYVLLVWTGTEWASVAGTAATSSSQ